MLMPAIQHEKNSSTSRMILGSVLISRSAAVADRSGLPTRIATSGFSESVRGCARNVALRLPIPATATTGRFSNGLTQFVEGGYTTAARQQ